MSFFSLTIQRHCAALLVSKVLKELFPDVVLSGFEIDDIGFSWKVTWENGLHLFGNEQLQRVEEGVNGVIRQDRHLSSMEMVRENAITFLQHHSEKELAVHLQSLEDQLVSLVGIDGHYVLSPLPHPETTREIGIVHLYAIEPLSKREWRIYGTAFPSNRDLKAFRKRRQHALKVDHRKLGTEMELFRLKQEGCYWLPRGVALRRILDEWRENRLRSLGFQPVETPNCDHLALFDSDSLPQRFCEAGEQKFNETQEELLRSSRRWVDQATIFCHTDQFQELLISFLQFITEVGRIFGFQDSMSLCLLGRKSALKKQVLEVLKKQSEDCGVEGINLQESDHTQKKAISLELNVSDALGRKWKCSTLSVEFILSESLDLLYDCKEGKQKSYMALTLTTFTSLERVIALLLERTEGRFPFWLCPEQVRVLSMGESQIKNGQKLLASLREVGIRAEIDDRKDSLGTKVHRFEKARIPYAVVLGHGEEKKETLTVRKGDTGEVTKGVTAEALIEQLLKETARNKV